MTDIESLARRVTELEDERAILGTLYRYGHALDYGAETDWLDCFTDDAGYELRYPAAVPSNDRARRYHGRDELAAFVALHTRAPDRFHKHLLIEPIVTINGDRAQAISYFMRVDDADGERIVYAFGRYLDHLVRGPDGRWRFTERIAEIESRQPTPAPRRVAGSIPPEG
jgi:hypothetical protein